MTTITEEQECTELSDWKDDAFHHAYTIKFGIWNGEPSLCGYKGPGPKFFNGIIPHSACPICVALVKDRSAARRI